MHLRTLDVDESLLCERINELSEVCLGEFSRNAELSANFVDDLRVSLPLSELVENQESCCIKAKDPAMLNVQHDCAVLVVSAAHRV